MPPRPTNRQRLTGERALPPRRLRGNSITTVTPPPLWRSRAAASRNPGCAAPRAPARARSNAAARVAVKARAQQRLKEPGKVGITATERLAAATAHAVFDVHGVEHWQKRQNILSDVGTRGRGVAGVV